ncbi:hypothetical protein JCM8547_007075 [Rhodosporidiobolus lusitaniae]
MAAVSDTDPASYPAGLPVELNSHVIRLALPSRYSPLTYRERRNTLRSFSLVSKAFHAISQPWLFEEAKLESEHEIESFLDEVTCTKSGWLVKLLDLRVRDEASLPVYEMPRFVVTQLGRLCPNLVELWVEGAPEATEIYMADLERLRKLERLTVDYLILTAPKPFSLPVLQELSLRNCTTDSEHTPWTVRNFPMLKHLHFELLLTFAPPVLFSSSLFRHVETLSYIPTFSDRHGELISDDDLSKVILLEGFAGTWSLKKVIPFAWLRRAHHLRLQYYCCIVMEDYTSWASDPSESDKVCAKLEQVASLLSGGGSPRLRSLYLPTLLQSSSLVLPAICLSTDWLLGACKEHKVEVLYELPVHFLLDSLISHEFWRRVVAERAEGERE